MNLFNIKDYNKLADVIDIHLLQSISMQTDFITNDLCYETAGIPSNYEIINISQYFIHE